MPQTTAAMNDPQIINMEPFRVTLQELPIALCNRIDREKRPELEALHPGLPALLRVTLQVSAATFEAIRYLAIDRRGGHRPRLENAVAIPPLARTFLDSLFTIVFLFDQPAERTGWFLASGWREAHDTHVALIERHGTDPAWSTWLSEHGAWVDGVAADARVTDEGRDNHREIRWWPNPGGMVRREPFINAERQSFLGFLNDWYYRRLSGDSHLSYMGLARRGSPLWEHARPGVLQHYHGQALTTALTLFLSLLSEIAGQLQCGYEADRLRAIWRTLRPLTDAREVYNRRYRVLLALPDRESGEFAQ